MVNSNVRVVQGFTVSSFVVKQDTIRIVLEAKKDDIRAGEGDIGSVLTSLELHATASDSAPIELTLVKAMMPDVG
jgi:hypothetical protein